MILLVFWQGGGETRISRIDTNSLVRMRRDGLVLVRWMAARRGIRKLYTLPHPFFVGVRFARLPRARRVLD